VCLLIENAARRGYRGPRKIDLNHEHRLMMQVTAKYDELSLIQKVISHARTRALA
jgi:hypothetical protein